MKKTIIFFSLLATIVAISSCNKDIDQPFTSHYYSITGTTSDSLGTGTASVTLNIADDGSVVPQTYGAGMSSIIAWSGLSAAKVDSIVVKGIDQNGTAISLLYVTSTSTINNGQAGAINAINYFLPAAQKSTMITGSWRFLIYAKANVVLANLNQVTVK